MRLILSLLQRIPSAVVCSRQFFFNRQAHTGTTLPSFMPTSTLSQPFSRISNCGAMSQVEMLFSPSPEPNTFVQIEKAGSQDSDDSPQMPHIEHHFDSAEVVRDVIIGLSDGLTVPFALAAGLASLDNSRLVVTAGLAEIIAGSISMGLGGYLAGKSEIDHYDTERQREAQEVLEVPDREEAEIAEIFEPYGVERKDVDGLIQALRKDNEKWVDFMMKFELNLEKPSKKRTWISALTIGLSYLVGGVIPLLPYIFLASAAEALYTSVAVTLLALFIFGFVKGRVIGFNPWRSALEMTFIGACAGAAAYGIAKAIPQAKS